MTKTIKPSRGLIKPAVLSFHYIYTIQVSAPWHNVFCTVQNHLCYMYYCQYYIPLELIIADKAQLLKSVDVL